MLDDAARAALEDFLSRHADSSMFLLANSRKAGLVDRGLPFQATYAAAIEGERIVAVAAHSWLGTVVVQAPERLADVVGAAIGASRRHVTGVLGPYAQALEAARMLGATKLGHEARELLYALDLRSLRLPDAFAQGHVVCRRPRDDELPLLTNWRVDYVVETEVEAAGPDLRARCAVSIELLHADGADFLLERNGVPVAYCCYNARIAEAVQIGGVWTPRELRGRGYARAVVAGALRSALVHGASRAVLFTPEGNLAARRSYESLGFSVVGDYGLFHLT